MSVSSNVWQWPLWLALSVMTVLFGLTYERGRSDVQRLQEENARFREGWIVKSFDARTGRISVERELFYKTPPSSIRPLTTQPENMQTFILPEYCPTIQELQSMLDASAKTKG